jgi:hypothetical protein
VGTAEIYNNTMYDCSSVLTTYNSEQMSCAVVAMDYESQQPNVTLNLVNNVVYQPSYGAGTGYQNVYICDGATTMAPITGSHNIWYSASTPGSTAYATTIGVIENPLLNTNGTLQSGSPAIGVGTNLTSLGITALDSDYAGNARPLTGAWTIGAYNGGTPPSPPSSLTGAVLLKGTPL